MSRGLYTWAKFKIFMLCPLQTLIWQIIRWEKTKIPLTICSLPHVYPLWRFGVFCKFFTILRNFEKVASLFWLYFKNWLSHSSNFYFWRKLMRRAYLYTFKFFKNLVVKWSYGLPKFGNFCVHSVRRIKWPSVQEIFHH